MKAPQKYLHVSKVRNTRIFVDAPDYENGFFRKLSDDGLEIMIYPVMYGYRIRVGWQGRGSCELDYCAGADATFVGIMYGLILSALMKGFNINEFPIQEVKPFYNDPIHFAELVGMGGLDAPKFFYQDHQLAEKKYELMKLNGLI